MAGIYSDCSTREINNNVVCCVGRSLQDGAAASAAMFLFSTTISSSSAHILLVQLSLFINFVVKIAILFTLTVSFAVSALTLLVGWQEGHPACKNTLVGCWCGYLSGARCRLACGPADATATHCLLLQ